MIRDRGLKKWHGFFMPEHTVALKDYAKEQQRENIPILDEQKLQEMNELIAESMEHSSPVCFKVYNKQLGTFEFIRGKVHYVDSVNQVFRIKDKDHIVHKIRFSSIADISLE
ncbi:YolD-like family protein (plasmid) [Rossellomorea sp. AcN35-11]|nr:YolD-like family protein [Rossellomorea aquimaris]WJV32109.1 YolD-like family protein [Rossellomorea sp. AcN35-11]